MDFAIDLKVALTGLLLMLGCIAAWAWMRPTRLQAGKAQSVVQNALLSAFVHAPVAVLWFGGKGELQMANVQARTLLGMDLTASSLPEGEWRDRLLADVQAVLASQVDTGRSRTLNLPDQQTWRWWVTSWGGGGLVFLEDVTALHQAEQATHLLLSDLAHELRTPLATLTAHLEVLRLPNISPEIHGQSLQFLRDETQRLVRLVNNTLELGRLQSNVGLEQRPLQLYPLVETVVAQLRTEAQANQIEVGIEAAANLPPIMGNADRLKQVLLNLLDNSIKYARAGDRVTVSLTRTASENGVACAVCDSGPGIAAEHLPHITRRFYRAVPSGMPGNGLGLALAAEIVRQHGAQLVVESKSAAEIGEGEETGTCVRFVLPMWMDVEVGR